MLRTHKCCMLTSCSSTYKLITFQGQRPYPSVCPCSIQPAIARPCFLPKSSQPPLESLYASLVQRYSMSQREAMNRLAARQLSTWSPECPSRVRASRYLPQGLKATNCASGSESYLSELGKYPMGPWRPARRLEAVRTAFASSTFHFLPGLAHVVAGRRR